MDKVFSKFLSPFFSSSKPDKEVRGTKRLKPPGPPLKRDSKKGRSDYEYKAKVYELSVLEDDDNSYENPNYKENQNEIILKEEYELYSTEELTSDKPFKYGLLSDLKDHVTNYTKGFYSCAGECIHFAVAVQLWHKLSGRGIVLRSPFDGVEKVENTITECYDQALRFLKFYSWLGPNAHDIICATADYIIDFKDNITLFVIENHIEKDEASPDYIITYDDGTVWYGDLKSFEHRKKGNAISYMNGLTEYDVVFFLSLSFIDKPTFTLGSYANKEPIDKGQIEYNVSPDWAHLDQKEPFFKIQSFVRHGEFYTFAGRIFHFVMPYIIMSCYELNRSELKCDPQKKLTVDGKPTKFNTPDRNNSNFKKERNKIVIPLLKCTISRNANATALGRFGNYIFNDLKELMEEFKTIIEIEWKTRWVGEDITTGKIPQVKPDMIISPVESEILPEGTSIDAAAQFTFYMKYFSLDHNNPTAKYDIRVVSANNRYDDGDTIEEIWAERYLGDPEADGRNGFENESPTKHKSLL
jgi:hypothetical protein